MPHTESSRRQGWLTVVAALVLAACQPADPPEAEAEIEAERLAAQLETAAFYGLEGFPDPVTLTDGKWEGEPYVEGGNTYPGIYLSRPLTSIGDLDGDGEAEVVTVLVSDTGGSGSFFHLVALRQGDEGLEHYASYSLGDRIKIPSLAIDDGGIDMLALVHAEGEPLCCPTQRVDRRYEMDGENLTLASEHRAESLGRVYGYLTWGHENHSFKTCSGDREGWAVDSIQRHSLADLYEEFANEPYEPVFVDVEARWLGRQSAAGFAQQFDDTIEITDVYRVEREGWGCNLEVDDLYFLGFGNEPSWRLEVRPDRAELSAMNASETLTWEGDGQLSNQQFAFENDDYSIGITYLKIPCRDTMSGAFFSHQAEFRIGTSLNKGCAVPGGLDERR